MPPSGLPCPASSLTGGGREEIIGCHGHPGTLPHLIISASLPFPAVTPIPWASLPPARGSYLSLLPSVCIPADESFNLK